MRDFKRLQVWERSHELTLRIYELTYLFPREEMYGLTSQTRRACASIPTNIAEGCGKDTPADFAQRNDLRAKNKCTLHSLISDLLVSILSA